MRLIDPFHILHILELGSVSFDRSIPFRYRMICTNKLIRQIGYFIILLDHFEHHLPWSWKDASIC